MALSNIAIADGKATPVTHTFVPYTGQVGNSAAVWYNKVVGLSARAWEKLTTLVVLSASAKQEHRLALAISLPKVAVIDGVEVPQGEVRGYATIICPYGLNTDDNLKDIFALLKNALANAQVEGVLKSQTPST